MRKGRIIVWVVSLAICITILRIYEIEKNKIPEEQKGTFKVYCLEEYKDSLKNAIKSSEIGKTKKIVFTEDIDESEFIATDRITSKDKGYERVAWSPMVIAIDKKKEEEYTKREYLFKNDNRSYTIYFDEIIDGSITKTFKDKIYYPNLNTREGELFFDFLLINVNGGVYPRNKEELENATKKVNSFLSLSNVVAVNNIVDSIMQKGDLNDEMYIMFEKDAYNAKNIIAYPSNTIIYEIFFNYKGNSKINEYMYKENWVGDNIIDKIFKVKCGFRTKNWKNAKSSNYFYTNDGYSYVEIPLKEE